MDYSSLGFCGLSASFAPSGSSVGSSAKLDEREVRIGNSCRARQTAFLVERKAVLGKTSFSNQQVPVGRSRTLKNDALDSRSPRPINSRSVNLLYYGDNLDVLRRHIKDHTIDLVYLDPPFNSSQDYNVLFAEKDGTVRLLSSRHSRTLGNGTSNQGAESPMSCRRSGKCPRSRATTAWNGERNPDETQIDSSA
jgi:hypothetical protein